MLNLVNSDDLGDTLFKVFGWLSAALAVLSVVFISSWALALVSLAVNGVFWYLDRASWYRRLPGALLLAFLNFIYVQVPVFTMGVQGAAYDFAQSTVLPRATEEYLPALAPAMLFFVACYLLMVLGMRLAGPAKPDAAAARGWLRVNRYSLRCLLVIGAIVLWVQQYDITAIFAARFEHADKTETLLPLLFNDRIYELLFPVIFFLLPIDFKSRAARWSFVGVVAAFILLNISSTSKGAILLVGMWFFLYPAAIFYRSGRRIYWPKLPVVLLAGALSVPFYFYSQIDRVLKARGEAITFQNVDSAIRSARATPSDETSGLDSISARLAVGLNDFVLIYREFPADDPAFSAEFGTYVLRSFLNLALPGTPYPEAYSPSSQMFPDVLAHDHLLSRLEKADYLISANTQPYTLFGFFFVLLGSGWTLLASFLTGVVYVFVFNRFTSAVNQMLVVSSLPTLYLCYGFDAALQVVGLMVASGLFVMTLMHIVGRLNGARRARLRRQDKMPLAAGTDPRVADHRS